MGKPVQVIVTREAGTCVDKFGGEVEGECLSCSQLARKYGILEDTSHARVLVCHS